jgi:elongation factor Ts
MVITADQVKQLREKTGAGMMDCKTALTEAGGEMDKAVEILRKKGLASAAKRAGRATKDGIIGHYIHMGGKVGVLVEVNCETDFVARTEDFQRLAKELAMHIAAAEPKYVTREDVPAEVLEKEKEIYRAQFASSGKPANVIDKIAEGKLESYFAQVCLLEQPSVRDPNVTIKQMIASAAAKTGENVTVTRFARFKLGELAEA